jgi:hypothetical protein
MTARRKALGDLIAEPGPPAEQPVRASAPAEPPAARARPTRRRKPARAADTANGRPSARDFVAPARRVVAREALKADVPADLGLVRRLHAYRLDKGVDIRDQVALAVDEWLTSQGY